MKLRWPPSPLGLGTPLNLALAAPNTRSMLLQAWWLPALLGVVVPGLMLVVDHALFAGASLQRVRELGSQPLPFRLLIVVYSGVTEELIYRLFIATFVAWLIHRALSRLSFDPKPLAQWAGVLVAALLFGLAHVSNLPGVPHPVLRAVIINGIAAIVLGWLYWWRGLEMAILTHMVAIVVLYIGVPFLL
jgi:membrane protease YdiL (CAAX protease family)